MLSLKKVTAVGSQNRQVVWIDVLRKLSGGADSTPIAEELASAPKRWIDLVPSEWIEIYGALYDESSSFDLSDSEIDKIEKDVFRTYSLFTRNSARVHIDPHMNLDEYYIGLRRVLYAASHTAGGYCQGINFIAAAFLLGTENNEKESFTVLCYLLKQRNYEVLFSPKYSSLVEYMKMFEKRLRKHNKEVYNHFQLHGFTTVCYAIEWFTTMFIVTSPGDLSSCSIDLVLIGMDDALIRVGLAVLDCLGPKILKLSQEDLQMNFKQLVMELDVATVLSLSFSIPVRLGQNMLGTMALNIQKNMPENGLHINTLLSSSSPQNDLYVHNDEKEKNSGEDETTLCNFQVNTFLFSDYSNKGDDEKHIGPEVAKEAYRNSFYMRQNKKLRQSHRESIKRKREVFLKKLRLLVARTEFLSSDEYRMKCTNDPINYPLKVSKKSVIGYLSDDENEYYDNSSTKKSVDTVQMIGKVLGLGLFNAFDAIPSVNIRSNDNPIKERMSSKISSSPEKESGSAKEVKVVIGKEVENLRVLDSIVGGIDNVVSASVWIGTLGLIGSKRVNNNHGRKHNDAITDEEYFGDIDNVNQNQSAEVTFNEKEFTYSVAHSNTLSHKKPDEEAYHSPTLDIFKSTVPMRSVSPTDMPTHAPRNVFHQPFVQPALNILRGPRVLSVPHNNYQSRGPPPPRGQPPPRKFSPMHLREGPRQDPPRYGSKMHGFKAINYANFDSKGRKSYNKSKQLYANI